MTFGLSSLACLIWWFVAGILTGWLLYWLFDRWYERDLHDPELAKQTYLDNLTAAEARTQAVREECDALRGESRKLSALSSGASADKSALSEALQASAASKTTMTRDLSSAQDQLSTTTSELETAKKTAETHAADVTRLRAEIDAAKKADQTNTTEISRLKSEHENLKKSHDTQSKEVATLRTAAEAAAGKAAEAAAGKDADIARLKADLQNAHAKAASTADKAGKLKRDLTAASALAATGAALAGAAEHGFVPRVKGSDDLTIIEGIGPKIADLLTAGGIGTFAKLAGAEQAAIKAILDKGGRNFALANPETWPQQAKLCVRGKWEELKRLQDELVAGNRPSSKS